MKKIFFGILIVMFLSVFTCPVIAQTEQTEQEPSPVMAQTEQTVQEPSPAATQQEPSFGLKFLDVVLVRPEWLIISSISSAAYLVIGLPAAVVGVSEPLAKYMVYWPWRYTSCRPIGDFNSYKKDCFVSDADMQ